MRESTVHVRYKEAPVLIDRVLQHAQKTLKEKLSWLDYAFGRSYRLRGSISDDDWYEYPAAYNGNGEYVSLLPNDNLGNFSWFDIYDPQKIVTYTPSLPQCSFDGALVLWYDQSSIYDDSSVLHTEEVKDEILRVLTTPGFAGADSRFEVSEIYERFDNIYKEDLRYVDKQFFMYPYAGIRIEFNVKTKELCYR